MFDAIKLFRSIMVMKCTHIYFPHPRCACTAAAAFQRTSFRHNYLSFSWPVLRKDVWAYIRHGILIKQVIKFTLNTAIEHLQFLVYQVIKCNFVARLSLAWPC